MLAHNLIGQGGMSYVVRARHRSLGRDVAPSHLREDFGAPRNRANIPIAMGLLAAGQFTHDIVRPFPEHRLAGGDFFAFDQLRRLPDDAEIFRVLQRWRLLGRLERRGRSSDAVRDGSAPEPKRARERLSADGLHAPHPLRRACRRLRLACR